MKIGSGELYEASFKIYHPFMGLISWKRRDIVSAIQHSLNTAAIAGDIAKLLTSDEDIIDLATYCGLLHDIYQKAKSLDESLTREKLRKVVSHTLEDIGLENNVIRKVLECCDYNVAENPSILLSEYAVAGVSVRLADLITSAENIYEAVRMVREEAAEEKIKKFCESLKLDLVSIFIPQVALRSLIYQKAIEKIRELIGENAFFIAGKGGFITVTTKDWGVAHPVEVEYFDLKKDIEATYGYILDIIGRKSRDREKIEKWAGIGRFASDSNEIIKVDNTLETFFIGVKLAGVEYAGGEGNCIICGLAVADPVCPTFYGYIKYDKASTEKWSPRYPGCINLNVLLQKWSRKKVYICPLCTLEALVQKRVVLHDKQRSADYLIQFFFTRPAHYGVASALSSLAHKVVVERDREDDYLKSLIYEPWSIIGGTEGKNRLILLDFTWAMHLTLMEGDKGEREKFAEVLPSIAKAILLTGIYPAKFTHIPDPAIERRLVMPAHPLYNYDINDKNYGRLVPLTLFAIALLHELEGGGKIKDRIRSALKYLDYPFWTAEDLLIKHEVGREVLRAYDAYIKDPYSFLFKK
ncbi:MAG: hypothetical protein QW145_04165 [Candidatus Bathyarchaeia archaeon]